MKNKIYSVLVASKVVFVFGRDKEYKLYRHKYTKMSDASRQRLMQYVHSNYWIKRGSTYWKPSVINEIQGY